MSWQTEMTPIVRALIDDMDSATYTDSRLQDYIVVAAKLVTAQITFDNSYTVDVVAESISPDPDTLDDNFFINLVCLRTACMIVTGEYKTQAGKGISFKDAQTSIDTRAAVDGKKALMTQICNLYEQERLQYMNGVRVAGRLVANAISHPDFCGWNSNYNDCRR